MIFPLAAIMICAPVNVVEPQDPLLRVRVPKQLVRCETAEEVCYYIESESEYFVAPSISCFPKQEKGKKK